jgi:uncharacterized protein YgiM (DUF1202 family)
MKKRLIPLLLIAVLLVSVLPSAPIFAAAKRSYYPVVITYKAAPVRASASNSGKKITTIPSDTVVKVVKNTSSWHYVEYKAGKFGYISFSYTEEWYWDTDDAKSFPATIKSNTASIYNSASTKASSFKKIDTLKSGEKVIILAPIVNSSYSLILYKATKIGYVKNKDLKYSNSKKVGVYAGLAEVKNNKSKLYASDGKTVIATKNKGDAGVNTTFADGDWGYVVFAGDQAKSRLMGYISYSNLKTSFYTE